MKFKGYSMSTSVAPSMIQPVNLNGEGTKLITDAVQDTSIKIGYSASDKWSMSISRGLTWMMGNNYLSISNSIFPEVTRPGIYAGWQLLKISDSNETWAPFR